MKVAYFILQYQDFWHEDYSIYPKGYGGGPAFARYLKEFPDFDLFGVKENFINLTEKENKNSCHIITKEQKWALRFGEPIDKVIPNISKNYDLIVHSHTDMYLNLGGLRAKQAVWALGQEEKINEQHEYLILYNKFQHPQTVSQDKPKIYYFTLGTPVSPTPPTDRKPFDYLFQCSRIQTDFGVHHLLDYSHKYKQKYVISGPLCAEFADHFNKNVDFNYTTFLGFIDEEEKIKHLKQCLAYVSMTDWKVPFNLSLVQALAYGSPVLTTHNEFTDSLIKNGYNGFFVENHEEIKNAINMLHTINPMNCYRSVLKYNHFNMLFTIEKCFEQIIND